jgi:hypothetical protein
LADLAEEEPDAAAFFGDRVERVENDIAIIPGSEHIWTAFWLLTDDRVWRAQGFGTPMGATVIESIPTHIPYTSILCYALDLEIDGEEFDRFVRLLRALDSEYLAITSEALSERMRRIQQSTK